MTAAGEKPVETRVHYRFRMLTGAKTPWKPVPAGYLMLPGNIEGIEFHEGEPPQVPRRNTAKAEA